MNVIAVDAASELRIVETYGLHASPGRSLTLECTVSGGEGDTTIWEGTAFSGCEILLIHNRFGRPAGTSRTCSNGAITGQSVRVESNSTYISQLEVIITPGMIGKNIVCNHDNGTVYTIIGHHQLNMGMSNNIITKLFHAVASNYVFVYL